MKHTMSMYQTKDAMIDAMQAEIDSLEAQLAEARKDSERLDYVLSDASNHFLKNLTLHSRERIDNASKGGER